MNRYEQKIRWQPITEELKEEPCYKCGEKDKPMQYRPHTYQGVTKNLICCEECLRHGILR